MLYTVRINDHLKIDISFISQCFVRESQTQDNQYCFEYS